MIYIVISFNSIPSIASHYKMNEYFISLSKHLGGHIEHNEVLENNNLINNTNNSS
jgi:hypothetical protein